MYKLLELRFIDKLQAYMIDGLDPHQTGFVRGFGTHVNITKLINEIRNTKKKDK
jgi:hypothetical protein